MHGQQNIKNCVDEITSFLNLLVFDVIDQGMTTEAWSFLCNQLMGIRHKSSDIVCNYTAL